MSPLGGWSVGISTTVAMVASCTVQWILTAFRRFTRPTRSALAALSGALLTRLLSRISQLDGLRLGLRFIIIELSIALVTVLATVDVDKARATALPTCEFALYAAWTLGGDGFGAFYCRTTEITIINTSNNIAMVSVTQTFV